MLNAEFAANCVLSLMDAVKDEQKRRIESAREEYVALLQQSLDIQHGGDFRQLVEHILEDKCPHCYHVLDPGFDGCGVLHCPHCEGLFCAHCMAKGANSQEGHAHVGREHGRHPTDYFNGNLQAFKQYHKKRRERELVGLLSKSQYYGHWRELLATIEPLLKHSVSKEILADVVEIKRMD